MAATALQGAALAKKAARVVAFCAGDGAISGSVGALCDDGDEKSLNVGTFWGGSGTESAKDGTFCGSAGALWADRDSSCGDGGAKSVGASGITEDVVSGANRIYREQCGAPSAYRILRTVLSQNPQVVPASIDLAGAQADLEALDSLRPRFHRLQKLMERADGTEAALGSDIMSLSLEGYALLKVAGKNADLEGLRKQLSGRFNRTSAPAATPVAPVAATV